jgi:membrane protease YdiL (CAAX protease family)
MRKQEDATAEIVARLLSGSSVTVLCLNLAVMAIIPAVCEEFLFRGLLITWLKRQLSNTHVVVFISAFIFSAIHLQFYGFVPRFLLGLYLGYLFMWTGSIWACIIVHFINNVMAVIVSFLFNNQLINTEYQHFGDVGENYWLIGLSVVFTTICVYFFYRKE